MDLRERARIVKITKFIEFAFLGFGAYYATVYAQKASIWVFAFIYLLLFALALINARYTDLEKSNLNLLIRYFYDQSQFSSDAFVRITIHKKISESTYEQYINYYPSGAKYGRKRKIVQGIVRYAFQRGQGEFTENFSSVDEKLQALIHKYNFRREEAEQRINDQEMSYYCCPIIDDGKVWGVLYMNARKVNTFPNQVDLRDSQYSKNVRVLIALIENEIT